MSNTAEEMRIMKVEKKNILFCLLFSQFRFIRDKSSKMQYTLKLENVQGGCY